MEFSSKTKKTLNILSKIATYLLLAFSLCVMIFTVITVATVDKNERSIFGYKFFIVQSDSMSLSEKNKDLDVHFNAGDVIIAKPVENKKGLQPGDIISFISANPDSFGKTITHMISSVEHDKDGKLVYKTFGTNTGEIDKADVDPDYILGVYSGKIPYVGNIFAFLKSTTGYILCIFLPFALLIGYNAVKCVILFRKYKKEQRAELQAEKDSVEEQRIKNEEMLKELMALKKQLEEQTKTQETADNNEE